LLIRIWYNIDANSKEKRRRGAAVCFLSARHLPSTLPKLANIIDGATTVAATAVGVTTPSLVKI
jgi:hypothetical protein